MAMRANVRFHARDIFDAPDNGKIYEVIDGKWCMSPAPVRIHQQFSGNLYGVLWTHIRAHHLGFIYAAPTALILDDENGLQPDIMVIARQRAEMLTDDGIEGAPDLVVEVLSPSTAARDRGIKMRRYAASGVPHFWLGVPDSRSIEAYRLTETGYGLVGVFGPGTVFRPELFPGLAIVVDDLWT